MSHTGAPPAETAADSASDRGLLGDETIRYAASFLLLLHLFAVGLGLYANDPPNNLQFRLRRLAAPYLDFLFLTVNFRFHHTYGEETDVGWILETEVRTKNGETKMLSTADLAGGPAIRSERLYRFSRLLANLQVNPDAQDAQLVVARSLARGFLTEWERRGVTVDQIDRMEMRLRAHVLLAPQEAALGENPDAPVRFESFFVVDVVPDGQSGMPLVNRRNQAAHVAPSSASRGSAGGAPRSASTTAPASTAAATSKP